MAVNCCHKEYAEVCEIHVHEDLIIYPDNLSLYQILRFGLLASSWFPRPLGISLWSALHVVLLVVAGPALWVLSLLTAFLVSSLCLFGLLQILVCFVHMPFGLIAVTLDLLALPFYLIVFCWSLVNFLAGREPIFAGSWDALVTVRVWKDFMSAMGDMRVLYWVLVPFGVPCMSGSLFKQTNRQLKTWARWCEEVVHMHEAIAL